MFHYPHMPVISSGSSGALFSRSSPLHFIFGHSGLFYASGSRANRIVLDCAALLTDLRRYRFLLADMPGLHVRGVKLRAQAYRRHRDVPIPKTDP
jgi:hypothetical protein